MDKQPAKIFVEDADADCCKIYGAVAVLISATILIKKVCIHLTGKNLVEALHCALPYIPDYLGLELYLDG